MSREAPTTSHDRVVVLGIDGVPWGMLQEWIADGALPAFEQLCKKGVAGPLRSTMPASTPLAWPSITTGVWPDRHGVYAFQELQSDYTHRMYTSRDVLQPALWDIISPAVVANVPMTYPAREIDGTMITGFLTDGFDEGFTYPPEFADQLLEAIPDYKIGLDWTEYRSQPETFLDELSDLLESRRTLLEYLIGKDDWELFFFVFTATDRLQHLIWEEQTLRAHYQSLDDILADVMAYTQECDATLFVVSDHGFGPVEKHINVNTFLEQEGFLTQKGREGVGGILGRLGMKRERVQHALNVAGIDEQTIVNRLPESIVDSVATTLTGEHGLYDVDFSETEAFMHGIGSVYVNDTERFDRGTVAPDDVDRVKSELRSRLGELTDPETGEEVLTVHDGDRLFPRDSQAPELVVDADRYVPRTTLDDAVFTNTEGLAADHRREGVFFAWGPDIYSGREVEAEVVDIAPTLLHTIGRAVPDGSDGRVLGEVYDSNAPPSNRRVETREYATRTPDETFDRDLSDVEERLKGLGYME